MRMTPLGSSVRLFPPITKTMAIKIAEQVCAAPSQQFQCRTSLHGKSPLYGVDPDEPCWYVYVPWEDGLRAIRSSRVVVISRWSGKILFDGSAGDEG